MNKLALAFVLIPLPAFASFATDQLRVTQATDRCNVEILGACLKRSYSSAVWATQRSMVNCSPPACAPICFRSLPSATKIRWRRTEHPRKRARINATRAFRDGSGGNAAAGLFGVKDAVPEKLGALYAVQIRIVVLNFAWPCQGDDTDENCYRSLAVKGWMLVRSQPPEDPSNFKLTRKWSKAVNLHSSRFRHATSFFLEMAETQPGQVSRCFFAE